MKEREVKLAPDFVKWFSELNRNSGKYAGGKGANLAEIYNLKIPVPPGFVVTAQAYSYFIEKNNLQGRISNLLKKIDYEKTRELDETTKEIRKLIIDAKIPREMEDEIIEAYNNLDSGNEKKSAHDMVEGKSEGAIVAVRSSSTAEDLEEASFAGQQETFLQIKGKEDLIQKIKECFASLYTSRATYYRNKKGFEHEKAKLAVVIQKMIDSDKSGVIFSKDPSEQNDNVIVEAVFGLGEGIVSGKITPDKYIVSRDLEILDKKINNKKIAIGHKDSKIIEIKLKEEIANSQVLKEYEMKRLAEFALKLENHYKKAQDIEFAMKNGEIYIVQTRAITTIKNRFSEKKELYGEVVLSGLAASPGIAVGKIKIIKSMTDLEKIKNGDVLVTKMTNPDMVVSMQKASAIITDEGGITSHAAIVSREMGIPCIVGTGEATTILKENEIITVNGFDGKVFKGKVSEAAKKEIIPVTASTKTKLKVMVDLPSFAGRAAKSGIKSVGLLRLEGIIAESGKHPYYFLKENKIKDYEKLIYEGVEKISRHFDELWIRTSDIRSDEFQNIQGSPENKEVNPMLGMHGIRFGIRNPQVIKAELRALKSVADRNKKIGVLLPQVISVDEVRRVKEFMKEINFSKAKLGVMVETPAAVQIIKELCEEGIDFVSFGTNDLTQYTLAVDRGNESVQYIYDEMNPAVLHQLEYVIRIAKKSKVETSICGQAGSKKEMVKFLVEKGIDSISVNADMAKEISEYVAKLESGTAEKDNLDFPTKLDKSKLMDPRELQSSEVTKQEEEQQKRIHQKFNK